MRKGFEMTDFDYEYKCNKKIKTERITSILVTELIYFLDRVKK